MSTKSAEATYPGTGPTLPKVRLSREIHEQLFHHAYQTRTSQAKIANQALREYFTRLAKRTQKQGTPQVPKHRMLKES